MKMYHEFKKQISKNFVDSVAALLIGDIYPAIFYIIAVPHLIVLISKFLVVFTVLSMEKIVLVIFSLTKNNNKNTLTCLCKDEMKFEFT